MTWPWLLLAVGQLMAVEFVWTHELLVTFRTAVFPFTVVFYETSCLYHLSTFSGLGTDLPQQVYVVGWEI